MLRNTLVGFTSLAPAVAPSMRPKRNASEYLLNQTIKQNYHGPSMRPKRNASEYHDRYVSA